MSGKGKLTYRALLYSRLAAARKEAGLPSLGVAELNRINHAGLVRMLREAKETIEKQGRLFSPPKAE